MITIVFHSNKRLEMVTRVQVEQCLKMVLGVDFFITTRFEPKDYNISSRV